MSDAKFAPDLLASAATFEDITDCVRRFYCGESKTLVPVGEYEWKIINPIDGRQLNGARVVQKRGRFRFERMRGESS